MLVTSQSVEATSFWPRNCVGPEPGRVWLGPAVVTDALMVQLLRKNCKKCTRPCLIFGEVEDELGLLGAQRHGPFQTIVDWRASVEARGLAKSF